MARFFEGAGERDYAKLKDAWIADQHAVIAARPGDDLISYISYSMAVRRYWDLNHQVMRQFDRRRRLRSSLERVTEIQESVSHSSSAIERILLSCERRNLLLPRADIADPDELALITDKLTDAEYEVHYIIQKQRLLLDGFEAMPGSQLLSLDGEGNVVGEMMLKAFNFRALLVLVPIAVALTVVIRLATTRVHDRIFAVRAKRKRLR